MAREKKKKRKKKKERKKEKSILLVLVCPLARALLVALLCLMEAKRAKVSPGRKGARKREPQEFLRGVNVVLTSSSFESLAHAKRRTKVIEQAGGICTLEPTSEVRLNSSANRSRKRRKKKRSKSRKSRKSKGRRVELSR